MQIDHLKLEVKQAGAYFAVWHILCIKFFSFSREIYWTIILSYIDIFYHDQPSDHSLSRFEPGPNFRRKR